MKTHVATEEILYDGTQLRSHFAYRRFGVRGDSMVAFRGPCRVELTEMVDLEDVRAQQGIVSPAMVHFIVEHFDVVLDLEKAVLRQRMLVHLAGERLRPNTSTPIIRRGDDLYGPDERKLSVSIATRGPVSILVHLGLNVVSGGAPVPTIGLGDLGVDPEAFARDLVEAYRTEHAEVERARTKVRSPE